MDELGGGGGGGGIISSTLIKKQLTGAVPVSVVSYIAHHDLCSKNCNNFCLHKH